MDSQVPQSFTSFLEEGLNPNDQFIYGNPPSHQYESEATRSPEIRSQSELSGKRAARSLSYTILEDKLLITAWINVSIDPIIGNEKKGSNYWKRIWEFFHEHKEFSTDRNQSSLMHRWSTIQLAVNKFCGYYSQIERRHPSGMTELDKIQEAKELYKSLSTGAFTLDHCWNMLKLNPKWLTESNKKKIKNVENASPGVSYHNTSEPIVDLGEEDGVASEPVNLDRPMGRKAAKISARKAKENVGGGAMEPSQYALHLQELRAGKVNEESAREVRFQKLAAIEQERSEREEKIFLLQQQQFQSEQDEKDDKVMFTNTIGMSELAVEYLRSRQMAIMEKKRSCSNNE